MKRKTWLAAFLVTVFLGSTYVAVSQTSSGLLAPFMVKRCTSITVGSTVKLNGITDTPMTLKDVERCLQHLQFPMPATQAAASRMVSPSDSADTADNPILSFACRFSDADSLAEGVLAKNTQEQLWNSDGLFHVIECSRKCSSTKVDDLRGSYCSCPH